MCKKDYELIASTIKQLLPNYDSPEEQHMLFVVADELGLAFERTGKKFDKAKFLTACGIETKVLGINWADGTSTIHTDKGIKTVPTDQVQQ